MIIFVHVPDFYAAVEQADRPVEGGRALIVGGDPQKGGTVTCPSAAARRAGVEPGMDLRLAQERCPDAELRLTRLRRYREVAAELRAILRASSSRIEAEGLDSTYLEAGEAEDTVSLAARLLVQIQAEVGIRAVAGIGPTRFVAHLAGRHVRAEGIREVPEDQVEVFLAALPVTEIWGLGPSTAEKLAAVGVERIGELQRWPLGQLAEVVGERNAGAFRELALGGDRHPLRPSPPVKSLSRETTLATPSGDLRSLGEDIAQLATRVEEMLNRERRAARTISVGVSFVDGERMTRTQTLDEPVSKPNEIARVALQLLARTQAGVRQVRRLRLQVSNLCRPQGVSEPRQLRLF